MSFLNSNNVLVLNSLWQIIGTLTPKKAIVAMCSENLNSDVPVAKSIDVQYEVNLDGTLNLEKMINLMPLSFIDWLNVPIRESIDNIVHTSKLQIRCPTVIVTNYSKMPMKRFKPTKSVLYEMQKGICGYTGELISPKQGNIEHKTPKSFGGDNSFENLMFVNKEINFKRGNRNLQELGLIPLFYHKTPKLIPANYTIKKLIHPDWRWFMNM